MTSRGRTNPAWWKRLLGPHVRDADGVLVEVLPGFGPRLVRELPGRTRDGIAKQEIGRAVARWVGQSFAVLMGAAIGLGALRLWSVVGAPVFGSAWSVRGISAQLVFLIAFVAIARPVIWYVVRMSYWPELAGVLLSARVCPSCASALPDVEKDEGGACSCATCGNHWHMGPEWATRPYRTRREIIADRMRPSFRNWSRPSDTR
ncbi:MAG: hypothetical protein RBS39_03305 [Phycisphaerales bacterium]|jgi:hypothetical protein|nr:hypothetical protein [Phycisphaerales bacterium]